jgi:hypothetical protein
MTTLETDHVLIRFVNQFILIIFFIFKFELTYTALLLLRVFLFEFELKWREVRVGYHLVKLMFASIFLLQEQGEQTFYLFIERVILFQFIRLMKVYLIGVTLSVQTIIVNYFRDFLDFTLERCLFLMVPRIKFNGRGIFCLHYILRFGFNFALFGSLLFFTFRFGHPPIDKYYKN